MLKTLGAQVKEYKKDSLLTPVFMILEVLFETIIPLMMASIIDDGVKKGDMRHIYLVGGCMVITALLGLLTGILGGKYGASASTGFAKNTEKQCMIISRHSVFQILISLVRLVLLPE